MENTNHQSFEDVKVFVGDNFYPASNANYKNLNWVNKGNKELYLRKTRAKEGSVSPSVNFCVTDLFISDICQSM